MLCSIKYLCLGGELVASLTSRTHCSFPRGTSYLCCFQLLRMNRENILDSHELLGLLYSSSQDGDANSFSLVLHCIPFSFFSCSDTFTHCCFHTNLRATQEDELGELYLDNTDFLKNGVPASIIATLVTPCFLSFNLCPEIEPITLLTFRYSPCYMPSFTHFPRPTLFQSLHPVYMNSY